MGEKKDQNYSAVNCSFRESKLNFRGVLSEAAFTNWLGYRCIRPKLVETKSPHGLPEIPEGSEYGIEDVEALFCSYMPKEVVADDKKKKDKDDKDDKKGKKDDKDDKKSKK